MGELSPRVVSELQNMIAAFRVQELQTLLGALGKNKTGKKSELQNKAYELLHTPTQQAESKIREIYNRRYNDRSRRPEPAEVYQVQHNARARPAYQPVNPRQNFTPVTGFRAPPTNLNIRPQLHPGNVLANSAYTINRDVKFKDLPFYDFIAELIPPTNLIPYSTDRFQDKGFSFRLSLAQVHEMTNDTSIQVQLRIVLLDATCEQDDEIPANMNVKVNGKQVQLPNTIPTNKPGAETKRQKRPVNLTPLIVRTPHQPNEMFISWNSPYNRSYVLIVNLVRQQSSGVLINRLKGNGVRNPDHTIALIKEKLNHDLDVEVAPMSLRGSLLCPLGKQRMALPCRALTCTHLQCFDAVPYIQMNEKKAKWTCPVCNQPSVFKSLAIDGLFLDITSKAPPECVEVQFHEDGSWTPIVPVKSDEIDAIERSPPKEVPKEKEPDNSIPVIDLDSDSDTEDSWPVQDCSSPPRKRKPVGVVSPVPIPPMKSIPPENPISKLVEVASGSAEKIANELKEQGFESNASDSLDGNKSDTDYSLNGEPILDLRQNAAFLDVSKPSSSKNSMVEHLPENPDSMENFDLYSLIDQPENFAAQDDSLPEIISID